MRSAGFFVLWLVASAVAVAVAWTGVRVVDGEIIDPAPASVAAQAAPPDSTTTTLPSPSSTRVPPTTSSSTTLAPEPASAAGGNPGPENRTTLPPPVAPPSPGPTPAQPPGPSPTPPSSSSTSTTSSSTTSTTSTTTQPPAPAGQTITFQLVGGSTAISFGPGGVDVVWATPAPGFEVRVEPEGPGMKVEFRSESHRSRIDAWWAGGPRHEIREEPD